MAKPYDSGVKRLLTHCMQDFLDWFATGALATGNRSKEFESVSIYADESHEAMVDDELVLYHLEIQSGPDSDMAQRLLEYNVLAYRRYKCPVSSYVIYLRKGGERPQPPLVRMLPDGREILRFAYTDIELPCYTPGEIFATGLRGLFPLIPFSTDGARREVIEDIIARLLPAHDTMNKELLTLTRLFASLAFGEEDEANQQWLIRRFAVFQDVLRSSPAFRQIFAEGQEEGREVGLQKGLEEGCKKGREEARQELAESLRADLLNVVQQRFPKLRAFARREAGLIESPEILKDLLLKVALAQTVEEAQSYFIMWEQADE